MSDAKSYIYVQGARVHNLKNIDVRIPHNQLVVVTGLSGSGKSTLAFDTVFAEGQRRYVESLSSYARQFLGRIVKPDVDNITGIAPAVAIEQKVNTRNPRSTVGTSTEIYDYLRLLYARVGITYSPVSGCEVSIDTVTDVVDCIQSLPEGTRVSILSKMRFKEGEGVTERLLDMSKEGFQRIWFNGNTEQIEEAIKETSRIGKDDVYLVIDRVAASRQADDVSRFGDSVQTAMNYGDDSCTLLIYDTAGDPRKADFSGRFEADGMVFEQPTEYLFSFNNPLGACPVCEGYGKVIGIDENLVIPDKKKSIYDDAVACWRGDTMRAWKDQLVMNSSKFGFPIHKPFYELSKDEKALLWTGNEYFDGLNAFFKYLESEKYKVQYRVMLSRYTGKTVCPECNGGRLRKEASYVKVGGRSITDLVNVETEELLKFFRSLELTGEQMEKGGRILKEITTRLTYLDDVGLGYLTLDRLSSTLSGGESQRINLSTSLGSSLVGSMYILDEPSIGLHPRDTARLINVLKQLRDLGNTVIVVEHEEEIIRAADTIIDIGPFAGEFGGEVVYNGPAAEIEKAENSLTADYLAGRRSIDPPAQIRGWRNYIEIKGARENNLRNIDVRFPLGIMTAVTGVSGSGKSSLVKGILYPALRRAIDEVGNRPGDHDALEGDVKLITAVEMVDQNPIGRSSRSNPVTYIKAYDEIRKLFSDQQMAKNMGFTPSHFSFNIAGGRCEECQGEGVISISMQFMADVELVCECCGGRRFKDDILEVKYAGKSIYDVLEMSVDEAVAFFSAHKNNLCRKIVEKLTALQDVGLGYVKLGQSSSTLSGGESQRVKLAYFLLKENTRGGMVFIFDEPTTGLHFHDIKKLLASFEALVSKGHTIVVVEHNMDVIRSCDWVIDLGPEGGEKGGNLLFEGPPKELACCKNNHTAEYLFK